MLSGQVVAVSHTVETFDPASPRYSKVRTPTGEMVYMERSLLAKGEASLLRSTNYDTIGGDLLIQAIQEGSTLKAACAELGLDYSLVSRWKAGNNEFRDRLESAYKDRAEYLHDRVIEVSESSGDAKMQAEAYKWSAQVYAPERFGNKTKISGDASAPLTMVIQTGVPERESPKDVTPQAEGGRHLPSADEELSQEKVEGVSIERD